MHEEAVRDYEHVCQQDKSRENKRLLDQAKVRCRPPFSGILKGECFALLLLTKTTSYSENSSCPSERITTRFWAFQRLRPVMKSKKLTRRKLSNITQVSFSSCDYHSSHNYIRGEASYIYCKMTVFRVSDRHASATDKEKQDQEKMFKELSEAYGILSDPKKKIRYDSCVEMEDNDDGGGFHHDLDPYQVAATVYLLPVIALIKSPPVSTRYISVRHAKSTEMHLANKCYSLISDVLWRRLSKCRNGFLRSLPI